ncbi:hypothetical protein ABVF61_10430 [Roseibium sp. HPY-6]|uniref:hypothetical protein n=1 Tax=Roseibium sp. HPY-6 TaxID=3229852 RepID=UPI00338F116B
MESILIAVAFLLVIGVGYYFIDRSRDPDRPKSHRHWHPDVDRAKAETMKNLETPPEK